MKKSLLFALTCLCAMPAQASVQDLIDGIKKQDLGTVEKLLQNGENVNAQNEQGNTPLHYAVALNNADIMAILTECPEFKTLDLAMAAKLMRGKQIMDCRNLLDANVADKYGFSYQRIGKTTA